MKFYYSFWCLLMLITIQACSSSDDNCDYGATKFPQQTPIDSSFYQNALEECRQSKTQEFQFENFEETRIVGQDGTIIKISPEAFVGIDNQPIQGELNLSLIEMYKPGDIMACQLSTNGVTNNQSVAPLLSEGIIYIDVKYQDEAVQYIGGVQIFIPSEVNNVEWRIFNSPSCPDINCKVLWEIIPDTFPELAEEEGTDGNAVSGYQFFTSNLGWLSLARYNNNDSPHGTMYNVAPSGYNLSNSHVFFNYHTNSISIAMFSEFDTLNQVFGEKYREIPKNTEGDVIFITKDQDNYLFDAAAVVAEDSLVSHTQDLKSGNREDLVNYLNDL